MPDIFKVPSGMQRSVSIVGLGNWGSSLAHALNAAGVSLQEVILSSERSGAGSSAWARTLPLTTLDRAQLKTFLDTNTSQVAAARSPYGTTCFPKLLHGDVEDFLQGSPSDELLA